MKAHPNIVSSALCAALSALALASPSWAADAVSKDEAQIRADLDAEVRAFQNRDAVGGMAAYVKDDRLVQFDMFPPETEAKGSYADPAQPAGSPGGQQKSFYDVGYAAALAKVKQEIDGTVGPLKAEVSDFHVVVDHNHAYSRYILRFSGTLKDGKPFDLISRTTDVYEKIAGKWLVVLEHSSAPPG